MNCTEALDAMKPGADQGIMVNLNETGDTKIIWDRTKPVETEIARDAFNKAKTGGYMAYKVTGEKGDKGEIMHAFDEKAERIILAPPLQGGAR